MNLTQARLEFKFLLKAARPGFWPTQLWFYLLPLAQIPLLHSSRFWLGAAYFSVGLGFLLYGWNDLVDAETDHFNPRKDSFLFGARGSREQLARLPWWIALVQLPFVAAFVWLEGPRMLVWFVGLVFATAVYNHFPPAGLKSKPPFEILNQLGYLLVFVGSSWLNRVPQLPWATFAFAGLFAMHSHLFGEVMDIAPDRAAGRQTTATYLGAQRAKFLIAGFLGGECVIVAAAFQSVPIAAALAAAAGWFVLDACWLWRERPYSAAQMKAFFLGWNAVALGSAVWIWRTGALSTLR